MIPPLTQNHHLEAVGWTLIHFCWQAGAVAAVYKGIDLTATRTRSQSTSHARYLFALVAMLGMFGAASGTLLYEELRLQRATPPIAANGSVAPTEEPASPAPAAGLPAGIRTNATSFRSSLAAVLPRSEVLLPWVDGLWMLGVLGLSVRTIGGWLLIQRLRRSAIQQVPPELAASFARLSQRIGIQSRVVLKVSSRIASPLAVGMFRSLILLPASALTTLSADQLEAVLAHELAHIRRADYLWNILQTMIETLFFFHPAVWYVGANLRQQRELCCDDIAIASSDPVIYATALLALEEHRARIVSLHSRGNGLPLALALDGHQSRFTLLSRIARILGEPMESSTSTRALTPFSILGVCAALAFFAIPIPQVLASLRPTALTPLAPATQAKPTPAIAAAPVTPEVPEALPAAARPTKPAAPTTPGNLETAVAAASVAAPEPAAAPAPVAMPAPRTSTLGDRDHPGHQRSDPDPDQHQHQQQHQCEDDVRGAWLTGRFVRTGSGFQSSRSPAGRLHHPDADGRIQRRSRPLHGHEDSGHHTRICSRHGAGRLRQTLCLRPARVEDSWRHTCLSRRAQGRWAEA